MDPLDEAVGLRPADLLGAVFDLLELQEEFVGVLVGPAAVLASVVAQDRVDLHSVLLEEGQRVVVQDLNGRDRHLRGGGPGPDDAAEAVQQGLDVDLADALRIPTMPITSSDKPMTGSGACRSAGHRNSDLA